MHKQRYQKLPSETGKHLERKIIIIIIIILIMIIMTTTTIIIIIIIIIILIILIKAMNPRIVFLYVLYHAEQIKCGRVIILPFCFNQSTKAVK